METVSYTHLDVYKRQEHLWGLRKEMKKEKKCSCVGLERLLRSRPVTKDLKDTTITKKKKNCHVTYKMYGPAMLPSFVENGEGSDNLECLWLHGRVWHIVLLLLLYTVISVSYTHLDVYKRQVIPR